MSNEAIGTPRFLKEEHPALYALIETINAELRDKPNISLAEFAENIDKLIVNWTYRRLGRTIKKQIGGLINVQR